VVTLPIMQSLKRCTLELANVAAPFALGLLLAQSALYTFASSAAPLSRALFLRCGVSRRRHARRENARMIVLISVSTEVMRRPQVVSQRWCQLLLQRLILRNFL